MSASPSVRACTSAWSSTWRALTTACSARSVAARHSGSASPRAWPDRLRFCCWLTRQLLQGVRALALPMLVNSIGAQRHRRPQGLGARSAIAKMRGALYGKRACSEGTAVLQSLALGTRRNYLLAAAGDGQPVATSQQPG